MNYKIMSVGIGLLLFVAVGALLWVNHDTTTYSSAFTEKAFLELYSGMSSTEVHARLGDPLATESVAPGETWLYGERADSGLDGERFSLSSDHVVMFDSDGFVRKYYGRNNMIKSGMPKTLVLSLLGEPKTRIAYNDVRREYYSTPGSYGRYNARIVGLDESGNVTRTYAYTTSE